MGEPGQRYLSIDAGGRKLYAEAHAAGVKEGEAERKELEEKNEYLEGRDRSLLEQHQASMITLGDKDLFAVAGRLLHRAEEAEAKLAEKEGDAIVQSNRATDFEMRLREAEAKLYDTEVKRGQDIMEFEREKKALNAELAAAKFEAKEAREKYQGVLGMRDSLARELAKLTAESGRIRVQAFNEMAEYCRREQRAICGDRPECIVGDAYKTGRHDGMGALAAFCEREAPSPEPEKPAPEVKP